MRRRRSVRGGQALSADFEMGLGAVGEGAQLEVKGLGRRRIAMLSGEGSALVARA